MRGEGAVSRREKLLVDLLEVRKRREGGREGAADGKRGKLLTDSL